MLKPRSKAQEPDEPQTEIDLDFIPSLVSPEDYKRAAEELERKRQEVRAAFPQLFKEQD